MRDEEPPLPPASPAPSRLARTLHSLRSPFKHGSPFHIGPTKRSGSNKSSASDSDLARAERTMRKRNKKNREPAAAAASDASRSTDSSPGVDKKKSGSFIRRMGTIGKKRSDGSTSASPQPTPLTRESTLESDGSQPSVGKSSQSSASAQSSSSSQPTVSAPTSVQPQVSVQPSVTVQPPVTVQPETSPPAPEPEPTPDPSPPEPPTPEPVSPIAVERPIATKPFAKAAWQRNSQQDMENPVEKPSPESAERRRIAFVGQASAASEEGERERGEVGSLEEAVALARVRLGGPAPPSAPHSRDDGSQEEGCADTMPAYGDLIEPVAKPGSEPPSHTSQSSERREHLYKILVIGELGTGKTSIIKRYVHQFFSQHYRATIGVDFALKVLNWDANTVIRLQLWDIAGQERFGNMTRVYYKEAVGAFIVFDVSRVATFDAVVKWKNDLDAKVQLPDGSPIPCILLANKCDQQKEGIVNSPAKMDEYCREKGFAGWFETSAKENINIEEAARSLVNKILLNDKLLQSNDKDGDKFALEHKIANGDNRNSSGKSCSC